MHRHPVGTISQVRNAFLFGQGHYVAQIAFVSLTRNYCHRQQNRWVCHFVGALTSILFNHGAGKRILDCRWREIVGVAWGQNEFFRRIRHLFDMHQFDSGLFD